MEVWEFREVERPFGSLTAIYTLRGSVNVGVLRARPEGVGPTVDGDRVRQLFEGPATRFREHYGREEAYARTTSLDLGKMQPSWDLQQHIHNILVSESIE